MGYSVYVQKFKAGEPAFAPFAVVTSVLERYGRVAMHGDRGEFIPSGDDICDVGYLAGSEALGLDGEFAVFFCHQKVDEISLKEP